ncbi:uncharacterized protein CELE_M03B6.4 [Caenorhabditis elegans]|uniref:Uncharacterized protein n=1 Tax=Caenorhabditis elegans TaxID=6239 RepID=Q93897_CAEEL|nr:Uncharacterized protein CELE_M03B6.4 [Caenorhabditis elegans]CAB01767.1 Uncharacterized protein CELE_M03B6.4 [Caenorhabditis elegans]|eukprot:NP_001257232.1 Uncharacterized protein CELE_M03B6.4 [Caenorhabditis elegans]
MSCLKISQYKINISSLSSPLKRKTTRKFGDDAYDSPKYFMEGNPTTTSTFEMGCDFDSINDENDPFDKSSMNEESILASSNQNSALSLLSAPSSIARNKVLACSTPKDHLEIDRDLFKTSPIEVHGNLRTYSPKRLCQDKRIIFRNQKIRNMAIHSPGTENIRTSYFTRQNRPIIEAMHREENMEYELKKQRAQNREKNMQFFNDHIFEFFLASIVSIWQIFYTFNVIPSTNVFVFCVNIAVCGSFSIMYMIPVAVWWGTIMCSLIVYLSFAWLFGATCNFAMFAAAAIFTKAIATVIQGIVCLVE